MSSLNVVLYTFVQWISIVVLLLNVGDCTRLQYVNGRRKVLNTAHIIQKVNDANATWTAGENFPLGLTLQKLKRLTGAVTSDSISKPPKRECNCEAHDLPLRFDARRKWPQCPSISHIYDQGNCGSCWAVAATSTFSDRLCIASSGNFNSKISAQALTSCCTECAPRGGCSGGWPSEAWIYIKKHGLVTGGDYNSNEGCQPYEVQPCSHHVNSTLPSCSSLPDEHTPKCQLQCSNNKYNSDWKSDHHKASNVYSIDPCCAMKEIYKHGPIQASFKVYEDFYTYKSGVYQYITGGEVGGHAVRIIGWGQERDVPYWLVANSWNEEWGDRGLFKIRRETNECWFEEGLLTGVA